MGHRLDKPGRLTGSHLRLALEGFQYDGPIRYGKRFERSEFLPVSNVLFLSHFAGRTSYQGGSP